MVSPKDPISGQKLQLLDKMGKTAIEDLLRIKVSGIISIIKQIRFPILESNLEVAARRQGWLEFCPS